MSGDDKSKFKYEIMPTGTSFDSELLKCFTIERVLQLVKCISSEPCTEQFKIIQALQIFQSASICKLSGFQEYIMYRHLKMVKMLLKKKEPFTCSDIWACADTGIY